MPTSPTNPVLSGPIWPVFWRYTIPSMAGLLALTTANIVDGLFIGNFAGDRALAALNLLIPYFTLLFGLALMLAIGGSVRAGRELGRGHTQQASALFSQCLTAILVISLGAAVLCLAFHPVIFRALGAEPALFGLMADYFLVIIWVLVLQLVTLVLYYFVRLDGFPELATAALVVGAGANILLDAWFVGLLDLGLTGAAWATGLAQLLQTLVLARYFLDRRRKLRLRWVTRGWIELLRAAGNGLSEWINEVSVGVVLLLLNWLLMLEHGATGVAAFTVVNYLIFLSLMLAYGIADAMHVLVSQNFGAGNHQRIRRFMSCGATALMGLAAILLYGLGFHGERLVDSFLNEADQTRRLAGVFLSVLWPLFIVNGLNVLISVYLTAMHRPVTSALVALSRSLVFPALLLLLINRLAPDWPLVVALPLSEWLTFLLAGSLFLALSPRRAILRAGERRVQPVDSA
ncbi:MATE family efflux transporter [Marinobacter bohaiensis]|uniref:MATE family efflux transporter n=1 Tax=Marinobacter bohaiensis TaxID=2201898 RepID=UPI000DAD431C|nr:MATE family efflux transporter [Marinobacter bohaiensis]